MGWLKSLLLSVTVVFFLVGADVNASAKYPKGTWECDMSQLEAYEKVPEAVRKQWLDINDFHDEFTLTRLYGNIGDTWIHVDYVPRGDDDFGHGYAGAMSFSRYSVADASIDFKNIEIGGIKLSGTLTRVEITHEGLLFTGKADGGNEVRILVTSPDFVENMRGDAPFKAQMAIAVNIPDIRPLKLPAEGILRKLVWHYALPQN